MKITFTRKAVIRTALFAGLGLLALIVAAVGFFVSPVGRNVVGSALVAALADGGAARYEKISGNWPGNLVIEGLALEDDSGPWLTVRRVAADWRPLALLTGRLSLRRLTIEEPVLLREPPPGEPSTEPQPAFEIDLPVALAVDEFTVTGGRVVAPSPAAFKGAGALRLDKRQIEAIIVLERTDQVGEHLRLRAMLDRKARMLALDVNAAGAEQGLFAALTGTPDLPAFRMEAKGEGPASDWRVSARGDMGTLGRFTLTGALAWTDRIVFDVTGEVVPGSGAPDALRDIASPAILIQGHVERAKGQERFQARLLGDGLGAGFDVTLSPRGPLASPKLAGTVELATRKTLALQRTDLTVGEATLKGKWGGTVRAPTLQLDVQLGRLSQDANALNGLKGVLTFGVEKGRKALRVIGTGSLDDAVIDGGSVIDTAKWSVEGAIARDGSAPDQVKLTLDSTPLSVTVLAARGLHRGGANADIVLEARDLSRLQTLVGVPLAGHGRIALKGKRDSGDKPFTAMLSGRIEEGVLDDRPLTPLVGEALLIEGSLALSPDGALSLGKTEFRGAALDLVVDGKVLPVLDLKGALTSTVAAVGSVVGLEGAGPLTAQLRAEGPPGSPRLSALLESPDATIENRNIGLLTVRFDPEPAGRFPDGRAQVTAQGPLGTAALTIPLKRDDTKAYVIGPFSGTLFGANPTGTLRIAAGDWSGTLDARFASLAPFISLATGERQRATGRGSLSLALAPGDGLKAEVAVRGVTMTDSPTAIGTLDAQLTRSGGLYSLSVKGRDLRVPGFRSPLEGRAASVTAKGPLDKLVFQVTAEGFTTTAGTVKAEGDLDLASPERRLSLNALSGQIWDTTLSLEAPTALTMGPDKTSLAQTQLKIGTGGLALSFAQAKTGENADVLVDGLPLVFLGRIAGLDWPQGRIDGRMGYVTGTKRPTGWLDMRLSNALLARTAIGSAAPLAGQITGRWDGRALIAEGEGARPGGQPFRMKASLPLRQKGTGMAMDPKGRLEASIDWTGRLGTLWALLPFDLHRLDGSASLIGTATGTWERPRLEGRLTVEQGHYESLATGTRLTDLRLTATAGASGADFEVTAADGNGGRLSGRGRLGLDYTADASLTLDKLRIVRLDEFSAITSGTATLTGALREPLLAGKLTLDRADAAIPDRLPVDVPQLPVVRVGEIAPSEWAQKEPVADSQDLALQLDIAIPGRAYLRGRGLTSEWQGDVAVRGTTAAPRITGEISLVRGQIAFGGRSYDLTRGRVTFDEGPKIDPRLDVATSRMVSGTDVSLTIRGPASAPRFDIASSPSLPRDEAMARFLFGKPAQSLSALELIDVARSVASLTGQSGGGFDPLEKTRRALGLDILTVGVGDNGGSAANVGSSATVSAGRYVSRRVYLGVKQGARADSSAVELNYEVTPRISLSTEVGQSSGGAAGVNWQWDY